MVKHYQIRYFPTDDCGVTHTDVYAYALYVRFHQQDDRIYLVSIENWGDNPRFIWISAKDRNKKIIKDWHETIAWNEA